MYRKDVLNVFFLLHFLSTLKRSKNVSYTFFKLTLKGLFILVLPHGSLFIGLGWMDSRMSLGVRVQVKAESQSLAEQVIQALQPNICWEVIGVWVWGMPPLPTSCWV